MMSGPIFLLSNFRSGSTVLRYALDAHPDICCPAELRLATVCQCLFSMAELTDVQTIDGDAGGLAQQIGVVRRLVDDVMSIYCRAKRKSRWCEKSPSNAELLYVISTVFPDAWFVCLHRGASDQVHSTLDYEGNYRLRPYLSRRNGDSVTAALHRWCDVSERLLAFEHAHHAQAVRILYEEFVAEPERELGRLLTGIGAEPVAGLSVAAFSARHDVGPRDARISATSEIRRDRVAKAGGIDFTQVPEGLRIRTQSLMRAIGYRV